jgi:hypothetical protein
MEYLTTFRDGAKSVEKNGLVQPKENGAGLSDSTLIDVILTSLHLEDAKASFDLHNVSDLWLPLPKRLLRRIFNDIQKEKAFYESQQTLLLSNPHLKPWSTLVDDFDCHSCFEDGEDHVHRQRILGEGGIGLVEEVTLKTDATNTICVRKTIARPKNLVAHQKVMTAFRRELKAMSQVDHRHCVRLLRTYTDLDSVNILLSPVADMDLGAYMEQDLDATGKIFLQRSIRCLCNAM